jgi:ribosome modulation factor
MRQRNTRMALLALLLAALTACDEQHPASTSNAPASSKSIVTKRCEIADSNDSDVADSVDRANNAADATLESLLSVEQQEALSVDEMTAKHREALRRALQRAYASGFTAGSSARDAPAALQTYVSGTFSGWNGQTVVRLQNGEIWRQAAYYSDYHYLYNPGVSFLQTRLGWTMLVDGTQNYVRVERVK